MGQIRLYKPEDMNQLLVLQSKVAEQLGIPFEVEQALTSTRGVIDSGKSVVIVAEKDGLLVGYIGAVISPSMTTSEDYIAKEVGWYVLPEYRKGVGLQLFRAMEKILKTAGVIYHVAAPASQPELHKIFKRLGYEEVETTYKKRL